MLAPVGTGFFYCRKSVLGVLDPPNVGYHSVDSTEDHMHYMLEYRQNAGRFEALANFTGIWGLDAAVRIHGADAKRIESHILELTGYAGAALQRKGWQIVSSRAQGEASGTCRSSMPAMTRRKSPSACATPGWTWRCAAAICASRPRTTTTPVKSTAWSKPCRPDAAGPRTYQSERNVMTMLHTMRRLALGLA